MNKFTSLIHNSTDTDDMWTTYHETAADSPPYPGSTTSLPYTNINALVDGAHTSALMQNNSVTINHTRGQDVNPVVQPVYSEGEYLDHGVHGYKWYIDGYGPCSKTCLGGRISSN